MQVIASEIQKQMAGASWIRKMFEKGLELKREFGAENVFDFSLGNPDMPPPRQAREVLVDLSESICKPLEMGYCPNAGLPAFREMLAGFLAEQQQVPMRAGHVVVTCGAAGALTSFFRAVLEPGDEVMCPAPYFVEYGAYCGHFGGVLKAVPALPPDFQPDLDAMAAAVTERTRVIIINSPNNPAGCIYTRETLGCMAELLKKVNAARKRPLYLVSDEPYRFLAYDGAEVPPVLNLSPYALVLGSFSKSLSLAGERVGYIAANPSMPDVDLLMNAVTMTNRTLGFVNAPVLGQRLVMSLMREGVDVAVYDERRRAMAAVLRAAGIDFAMPQGAFYFFPKAPNNDDKGFVQALLAHNILAVPGTGFGFPGYFRLTFCVDKRVIEKSAPGFKAAVQGFTRGA
ncbi:MAG: pyridoxal phosphate-dependent aminotransferase [Kiritimatiellae bacterium]|nr:pyridoxal phosphate-dependent aminotransferase [Kiritimatiellia bacterium]